MHGAKINKVIKILSALDVIGISFVLIIAFILQFYLHEPPCPLCILQRIGLLGIAFGFLLNVHFKIHPGHYALSLLSAILTACFALRQVLLHIIPGTGAYGAPFLGLHLYTWTFILCVVVIIYISLVLGISSQYGISHSEKPYKHMKMLSHSAFALLLGLAIANAISTYCECGLSECPDDPTGYRISFKK